MESEDSSDDEKINSSLFINPLLLGKKAPSDEEWSEDEASNGESGKSKKKDSKLGKRKKREDDNDFFSNKEIEVVP